MEESRRRFLQDMTALGAIGGASAAFGAGEAEAQETGRLAQAQPAATPQPETPRPLPRIQLMIGPGTLPSVGKDRMDLLRYLASGNSKLTGEQMLDPCPRSRRSRVSWSTTATPILRAPTTICASSRCGPNTY